MLRDQFGRFIPGKNYELAFDRSILLLEEMSNYDKPKQDEFYYFLHSLVIEIFDKFDYLENEIEKIKDKTN